MSILLPARLARLFGVARVQNRRRGAAKRPRPLWLEHLEFRQLLAPVTIVASADNTLYESSTGSLTNGKGIHLFAGRTGQADANLDLRRGVLKFDIAAQIPAGARIDQVTLTLNESNVALQSPGAQNFSLHTLLADWGEGTTDAASQEGTGGASTTNSATWLHRFFPATTWGTAGGSFTSTASATTSVGDVLGPYNWSSSQMVADVQAWLDQPSLNFGWLLKAVDETVRHGAKRFDSREISDSSKRPKLTIEYTAAVNNSPTLNPISDPPAILEDAGQQAINLAGITAGVSETQALSVTANSSNTSLIPHPAVTYTSPQSTGSLAYTPVANQSGTALITVTVRDAGVDGNLNNGDDATFSRTFTVTVDAVNDAPSFVPGSDQQSTDESGPQSTVWATNISAGPIAEAGQVLDFVVSNDRNDLFSAQPAINAQGQLTYTPAPNTRGTATITVALHDNGGAAEQGIDTSPSTTFTITITKPHVWYNALNAYDVNFDTHVSPIDALLIINYLNEGLPDSIPPTAPIGPPFYDVNRDDFVAPIDALLIINVLNAASGGEGESAEAVRDAVFAEGVIEREEYDAHRSNLLGGTGRRRHSADHCVVSIRRRASVLPAARQT